MSVAVAGLALHHDAGFVPAAAGHVARLATAYYLCEVFLAAEEHLDVLVQAATAIEAYVDNDAVLFVIFTHDLAIHLAVALVVHRLDVDVAQSSSRDAIYQVGVVLYPALVEQVVHCPVSDGQNHLVKGVAALVADGD